MNIGDRVKVISMKIEPHEKDYLNPNDFIGQEGNVFAILPYIEDDPYLIGVNLDDKDLQHNKAVSYWREQDLMTI